MSNTEKWDTVVSHMATTNECLKNMTDEVKELSARLQVQNGRITKLEHWKSKVLGAIAICTFIIALIVK